MLPHCCSPASCSRTVLLGFAISTFIVVSTITVISANSLSLAMANYPHAAGAAAGWIGLSQYAFGGIVSPVASSFSTTSAVPMAVSIAIFGALAGIVAFTMTRARAVPGVGCGQGGSGCAN